MSYLSFLKQPCGMIHQKGESIGINQSENTLGNCRNRQIWVNTHIIKNWLDNKEPSSFRKKCDLKKP